MLQVDFARVQSNLMSGKELAEDSSSIPSPCRARMGRNRYSDDQMAAIRLSAASKRSLKMRTSGSSSGGNRPKVVSSRSDSESPSSPSSSEEDTKRSKADQSSGKSSPAESPESGVLVSPTKDQVTSLFQRRNRNHSDPLSLTTSPPKITLDLSRIPRGRLDMLLKKEPFYRPKIGFLYYVNPVVEEKVDATLRNEAVHSLRFMHNAFFTLSAEAFCKAVNLIDRFIAKVKVKPKYMACVASAAYYIAAKIVESTSGLSIPSPDALVRISHCGGTAADLLRMEDILTSKLGGDLDGVNAFDFLHLFASLAMVLPEDSTDAKDPQSQSLLPPHSLPESGSSELGATRNNPQSRRMYDIWSAMTNRLVVAFCSLEVYQYEAQTVALAVLHRFNVEQVEALAEICDVSMESVLKCSKMIEELYDVYYRGPLPATRKTLVWNLSKRTLLRLGCSSPTTLDTISEDCETDKEDNLQFTFEP